jgi:cystathionine beta-lyase/cystathionine gamma-synthase
MTDGLEKLGFATRAVHAGERATRLDYQPVSTPIFTSVAYTYPSTEDLDAVFGNEREGFVYARYGNPTTNALESAVASLEGGGASVSFASGMAAIDAAFLAVGISAGDKVVVSRDVYGATYALLSNYYSKLGVETTYVDITDLAELEKTVARLKPKFIFCETISNPLLRVADLPRLAEIAHANGALLLVDHTFATPYILRPLELGADLVIHSLTKFLSGHHDVLGGVVVGGEQYARPLREAAKAAGGVLSPFEGYLALRGLKTLPLRMAQHCRNAMEVANWLAGDPRIEKAIYPGLSTHPQHELAAGLFRSGCFGGMVAFELAGGTRERVFKFFDSLKLCQPATTLGDVYTLVLYPPMSSHRALTPEQRQAVGIAEGLVRISVGIEDVADIIGDLDQALTKAG